MGTQNLNSDHNSRILSILKEQRANGLFTDVKIVSPNAVFCAHACVLAPFSSLVSKMFHSKTMSEENLKWSTQSPCILEFPNFSPNCVGANSCHAGCCEECIQKVIDYIYCGQITFEENHKEHMKFVADFLEIEDLILKCELVSVKNVFLEEGAVNNSTFTVYSESEKFSNGILFTPKNTPIESNYSQLSESLMPMETTLEPTIEISVPEKPLGGCIFNDIQSQDMRTTSPEYSEEFVESAQPLDTTNNVTGPAAKTVRSFKKRNLKPSDLMCLCCPFEGSSIRELLNHKLDAHHEEDTDCFLCYSSYSSSSKLQQHLFEHLNSDVDTFTIDTAVKSQRVYKCDQCNKEFRWYQNYSRHLSSHKAPQKKCEQCDFIASTSYVLKHHINKEHSDFSYSCYYENCLFKSKRKGNLKDHILAVHKSIRLCCPNCDKTFTQKKNLQRHINLYHNSSSRVLYCSLCSYTTYRADNLQTHRISTHENPKSKSIELPEDENFLSSEDGKTSSDSTCLNFGAQIVKKNKQCPMLCQNSEFSAQSINSDSNAGFLSPVKISDRELSAKDSIFSSGAEAHISCFSASELAGISQNFSVLNVDNGKETDNSQVSERLTIPDIDCKMTGTVSFNETAGTLTYHNLNSESTGALILNEITGELTYIKLLPQQLHQVANLSLETNHSRLSCELNYSNLQQEMNYSHLTTENKNTLILNESTGELDLIKQSKESDILDFNTSPPLRNEDDVVLAFDPIDEDEDETDLPDIDLTDLMDESNSNSEIPVLNEWTGEINLLPNNFLGGPFLDEQTGQLSVFDLFDNDLIFDCLEEPAPPNIILNENTGEILCNNSNEEHFSSTLASDLRPSDVLTESNRDSSIFCDDLTLDNNLEYSLNETTGQLSIAWPDVSEDSNFSFLLNELTGELSIKEISG